MKLTPKLFTLLSSILVTCFFSSLSVASDEGAQVFAESCTPCHTPSKRPLDSIRMSREQWKEIVSQMIDQGAEVPKDKMPTLLDYLLKTHGSTGAVADSVKK